MTSAYDKIGQEQAFTNVQSKVRLIVDTMSGKILSDEAAADQAALKDYRPPDEVLTPRTQIEKLFTLIKPKAKAIDSNQSFTELCRALQNYPEVSSQELTLSRAINDELKRRLANAEKHSLTLQSRIEELQQAGHLREANYMAALCDKNRANGIAKDLEAKLVNANLDNNKLKKLVEEQVSQIRNIRAESTRLIKEEHQADIRKLEVQVTSLQRSLKQASQPKQRHVELETKKGQIKEDLKQHQVLPDIETVTPHHVVLYELEKVKKKYSNARTLLDDVDKKILVQERHIYSLTLENRRLLRLIESSNTEISDLRESLEASKIRCNQLLSVDSRVNHNHM